MIINLCIIFVSSFSTFLGASIEFTTCCSGERRHTIDHLEDHSLEGVLLLLPDQAPGHLCGQTIHQEKEEQSQDR